MYLKEIVEEISEKTEQAHALSPSSILRKVNNIQAKLFSNEFKQVITTQYDILADLPFYPCDIKPGTIIDAVVNGVEYVSQSIKKDATSPFYYLTANSINLYPTPTEDSEGGLFIFHYKEPKVLGSEDMDREPDLDSNYHLLLVYGVCIEIETERAKLEKFREEYKRLIDDFNKSQVIPDYIQIENVYGGLL